MLDVAGDGRQQCDEQAFAPRLTLGEPGLCSNCQARPKDGAGGVLPIPLASTGGAGGGGGWLLGSGDNGGAGGLGAVMRGPGGMGGIAGLLGQTPVQRNRMG